MKSERAGFALVALLLASTFAAGAEGALRPLIPKRADPYVLRHSDGWYYFCATVPEYDRIELRKARDLDGLTGAAPATAWRRGKKDGNLWAPELHFIGSKWYLYFAAGTSREPYDVRMRVLECGSADPLAGPWKDLGKIETGRDTLSLDATSFEWAGVRYLAWAQRQAEDTGSPMDLYIAALRDPATLAGEPVLIGRASQGWEMRDPANLKMQGAAALKRGGRLFLAYSSNATDERYAMGFLELKEGADPLARASWARLPGPFLRSDPALGIYGPGHNSFTSSPSGEEDYIVFHARDYEKVAGLPILDPNRATYVLRILWDAEGKPVLGGPR
jgi:GH43 family beta-xylosidase